MYSSKIQKSTSSNFHNSKPFFKKSGESNFFVQTKESQKPFFNPSTIQAKLTIGQPGDKYEQEADMMADRVVQKLENPNPSKLLQKKCTSCEKEEKVHKMDMGLMRKPIFESENESTIQTKSMENQLNASKGGGKPMKKGVRSNMESAFGADFSKVKVHTDSASIQMNRDLYAKAFTNGSDVYFNQGQYNPQSSEGKHLLAHELTHTIQQKQAGGWIMRETEPWYRGEAIGGARSKPGGSIHDLGDGLYFSDREQVANQYAETRAKNMDKPEAATVYKVDVDLAKQGPVLDLTKDARWQKFLDEPLIKQHTRRSLIISINENYGKFFNEFVKANNIDVTKYKIIIAEEFVRGGKQMNVRDAELQTQLRQQSRLKSAPRFSQPTNSSSRPRTKPGRFRGAGKSAVGGGLLLLGELGQIVIDVTIVSKLEKIIQKLEKRYAEQQRKEIANAINRQRNLIDYMIKKQLKKAAAKKVLNENLYANITFDLEFEDKSGELSATFPGLTGNPTSRKPTDYEFYSLDVESVSIDDKAASFSETSLKRKEGFSNQSAWGYPLWKKTVVISDPISLKQKAPELSKMYGSWKKATGKFNSVSVDYQSDGLLIKSNFSIQNMKDQECRISAYFYYANGEALKDFNDKYDTGDGKVSNSKDLSPGFDDTTYTNIEIFMPYKELHMAKGKHDLKFYLSIYPRHKKVYGDFFASSAYHNFVLTQS